VSGVRTGEDITLTEFDYEKFAELIVQECKQAVAAGLKSMKYTSFDVSYISRLVDPINTELDRILK